MMAVLVLHTKGWGRRPVPLLIALLPLAYLGILFWWHKGHIQYSADISELDNSPKARFDDLKYAIPILPQMLVKTLGFVAGAVGLALLPLSAACFSKKILARAGVIFTLLALTLFAGIKWWEIEYDHLPLAPGETWAFDELGATEPLVPGYTDPPIPEWLSWVAMVLGWASFSLLLATQVRRRYSPAEAFFLWLAVGHCLVMAVLWLFYDRYALVLLPPAILLVLAARPGIRPRVAIVLLSLFGLIAVVGVRDHLEYNSALWNAVGELRESGAGDAEIDGGYVVNGWLQYAHPENAHRDEEGKIMIPGVNTQDEELRYQISNAPRANWKAHPGLGASTVGHGASPLGTGPFSATAALITGRAEIWKPLKRIPYQRWLGRSGNIYILVREESQAPVPDGKTGKTVPSGR
jgi:hypothetical protein